MPRDSNGDYTLPSGNPVVADTDIESAWANNTLDDIATAITQSLSRYGEGEMLGQFFSFGGDAGAPGITFQNDQASGFYLAGVGDLHLVIAGVEKMRWTTSEVAEFYIGGVWTTIEDIAGTGPVSIESRGTAYTFTADDAQTLQILTGSTDRTWLLPTNASVPFDTGTTIILAAEDADLTIDPDTGVTLTSTIAQDSTASRILLQGGSGVLIKIGTNHWLISGDFI